jgi:hypothetical protein
LICRANEQGSAAEFALFDVIRLAGEAWAREPWVKGGMGECTEGSQAEECGRPRVSLEG